MYIYNIYIMYINVLMYIYVYMSMIYIYIHTYIYILTKRDRNIKINLILNLCVFVKSVKKYIIVTNLNLPTLATVKILTSQIKLKLPYISKNSFSI